MRSSVLGAVFLGAFGASAYAADLYGPAPAPMPGPHGWFSDFKVDVMLEGGITGNPDDPGLNFGQLFGDKANEFLGNDILLTAHRDIDPKKDWDIGMKFQFMYGSDARYTHFLGELDDASDQLMQPDIVENWIDFKTPWIGKGGMEIKVGQYVTLEGAEVIDPRGDYFYSHSYIFYFGIPFKHTGVMTTTHVNDTLDIYAGADTGVNTTFGPEGDPNNSGAFHGGFGLHLLNNNLNILASTHIGPENPANNTDIRYLSDITAVWKLGEKLTSITDFNYIHDEVAGGQSGGGIAQYFTYAISDWLSVGVRGEFWRDPQGFWVAEFPCNTCFVQFEKGVTFANGAPTAIGAGPATYTELTFGLNVKPFSNSPKSWMKNLLVRPEVRWDHSFETRAYDNFTNDDQFTIASDFVVVFQ
jgi:hypothetical protein